jgi:hypothetical protein
LLERFGIFVTCQIGGDVPYLIKSCTVENTSMIGTDILHRLRGVRDRRSIAAAGSGELGASLSYQMLQRSHREKERNMTTASLERTKVSILPSAFADINIHKSRSVYF